MIRTTTVRSLVLASLSLVGCASSPDPISEGDHANASTEQASQDAELRKRELPEISGLIDIYQFPLELIGTEPLPGFKFPGARADAGIVRGKINLDDPEVFDCVQHTFGVCRVRTCQKNSSDFLPPFSVGPIRVEGRQTVNTIVPDPPGGLSAYSSQEFPNAIFTRPGEIVTTSYALAGFGRVSVSQHAPPQTVIFRDSRLPQTLPTRDFRVEWDGARPTERGIFSFALFEPTSHSSVECREDVHKGSLTVDVRLLDYLPPATYSRAASIWTSKVDRLGIEHRLGGNFQRDMEEWVTWEKQ